MSAEPSLTKVCVLTPTGVSAVSVLRLAGPDAVEVLASTFRPVSTTATTVADLRTWLSKSAVGEVRYGHVVEPAERGSGSSEANDGDVIDDVLLARVEALRAPDVDAFDICTHGGMRVVEEVLAALVAHGATLQASSASEVWPAPDRLDEAALGLLPRAKTELAVHYLLAQPKLLRAELLRIEGLISAGGTDAALSALRKLCDGFRVARRLIDGATVALVGPPNSGKSTLLNALAGREAAIVSPAAGTTRDWVDVQLDISGMPMRVVDTAGVHGPCDSLENLAIDAGAEQASQAEVVLVVLDANAGTLDPGDYLSAHASSQVVIQVLNKIDVLANAREASSRVVHHAAVDLVAPLSAQSGDGLGMLTSSISSLLGVPGPGVIAPSFFTESQVDLVLAILQSEVRDIEPLHACIRELIGELPKSA